MDPWSSCQVNVTRSQSPSVHKFEDNFTTQQPDDKLPDSDSYLKALEDKLRKLKSDPDLLKQLSEKREACMHHLLHQSNPQFDLELDLDQEVPVLNNILVRALLPQQQALNQGEIVELVKYDQLDGDADVNEEPKDNRSP